MSSNLPTTTPPTINDRLKERSLLDVVPEPLIPFIEQLPKELLEMSEPELKRHCYPEWNRKTDKKVSSQLKLDNSLRLAFWNEYDRAVSSNRRMIASFIYGQIVHSPTWNKIVASPHRLAWILCPPGDYVANLTHALNIGVGRLEEIFKMPIRTQVCRCHYQCVCLNPDGLTRATVNKRGLEPIVCACRGPGNKCVCPPKYDPKVADIILKALERVEMRVKGAVIQKVDERRLQVNLFGKAPGSPPDHEPLPTNMEDIDKRIRELEQLTGSEPRSLPPSPLDNPFAVNPANADAIDAEFTETDPTKS